MPTFAGRVEARMTVPSGTTVSASTGALSSPVTVTLPAANYYLTEAGGVESLLETFQTYLNNAAQGYPTSAATMGAAVGSTWTAGWLCNETSGNLVAAFGGNNLTPTSTPTYATVGPRTGVDLAVGFDSASDAFDGGANYDVGANDLCVAWVGYLSAAAPSIVGIISKVAAALGSGWTIYTASTPEIAISVVDGGGIKTASTGDITAAIGKWYVGMACVDRSTGKLRIGIRTLDGVTTLVSSETTVSGNITTAANFTLGANAWVGASQTTKLAAVYVGTGSGAATGLSAGLSTALTSFASAVFDSWTVSMPTSTGLVTASGSFWPRSISWTSTDLRDVLGFDRNVDYPQTAAQLAAVVGGTWTSGAAYLCNESSGSLSPVFGSTTLTALSTPTYSNAGARGGDDKAIGFDSASDGFSGGDTWDVSATDDLIILWVGRHSATAPTSYWFSKGDAAPTGYFVACSSSGVKLDTYGSLNAATANVSNHVGEFHVGMAVVDRSTGKMRIATQGLRTGTQDVSAETTLGAHAISANAVNFCVGAQAATGVAGPSTGTLSYFAIVTGTGVATGLSAGLSTALSAFAAHMKSQTGAEQARSVWFPGSPLHCDEHPSMAPDETDLRASESPTGVVLGLSGNVKYVHNNVGWERVAVSQIREAEATYDNGSFETFFRDAISGMGHEWMTPCSPMQIYWSSAGVDTLLGGDANDGAGTAGWTLVGVRSFRDVCQVSQRGWVGQWNVTFGRLVSVG